MLSLFKDESNALIRDLIALLESIEENPAEYLRLAEYGQIVDRIMGSAKTMSVAVENKTLSRIAAYTELCKILGYQGSQIQKDEQFVKVVVAFLIDATEMLESMMDVLGTDQEKDVQDLLSKTFFDRLQWISSQFSDNVGKTVGAGKNKKAGTPSGDEAKKQIMDLLKTLGGS